ncbi:UNVERIFIED_CONTAM: hypothetical protein GTU68_064136 [Idotea baltica]|nr:hypothetical protein [Idotea baltica]
MPLKYAYDSPTPNKIIGMFHGVLFIFYILAVIQVKIEQDWPWGKTAWALLASIIPFGTFWADKKFFREQN